MTVNGKRIVIWDLWVRLFHWALVAAVAFQLFSGETGELFFEYHKEIGEVVLGLILFRLLWGFIGSSNARFWNFIKSPVAAVTHVRELLSGNLPPERGHNAAGGWAVIGLLLLITTQAVTGLFIADEDELMEGALYGSLSESITALMFKIHHTCAGLLMAMIALHLLALLLYFLRAGQNLVLPMLTGKMQWPADRPVETIKVQQVWVGLICALVAGALVYLVVR